MNARVFIAFRRSRANLAPQLFHALSNRGYDVFMSDTSLPAGADFPSDILRNLRESRLLVFLITEDAIEPSAFTMTELYEFSRRWPAAAGHLLPVLLEPVPMEELPPYLRSVTVRSPVGNEVLWTVARVAELLRPPPPPPPTGYERKLEEIDGHVVELLAKMPITTHLVLRVDGLVVAEDMRRWTSSVACGIGTIFGLRQRWVIESRSGDVCFRGTIVTNFVTHRYEIERIPVSSG